jgi:uncharacterized protein (DUF58 family)
MAARSGPIHAALLCAVVSIALVGIVLRATALVGLAAAWTLLLLASRARALGQARVLSAGREVPSSGLEDEAVPVEIALDNRGRRAALFTEILDDFGPALADRQALLEPGPLPGGRRRHLRYRTACSRRWGIYTVGPLRLTTGDPFGLFRVVVPLAPPAPFAVFPRLVEMTALFRLGGAPSLSPQERGETRAGQGALVLGVRDYRAGDDVRRMHWPAFARRGSPAVRELERDLLPYLTLFLDLAKRHRAGTGLKSTIEYLVRTAASGALVGLAARRPRPALRGGGDADVRPARARGRASRGRALRADPRAPGRGDDLLDLVERHGPHVPSRSTAVILSGTTALDEARLGPLLDAFAARRVTVAVLAVEADSFLPIDRLASSVEIMSGRRRALLAFLRDRGVAGTVLAADDDLPATPGPPDLLEARS